MRDRLATWSKSLDEPVSGRFLAPLRIALGPLVALHLLPFLSQAAEGTIYRDRFWLPYADWYPHLPRGMYEAVLWLTLAAAISMSVGLLTRAAAWVCAGGVAYNLFLSQTHFHHNRAFLLILLVGVAVLPAGASLSLDRRLGTPRFLSIGGGRRLSLAVLRFEVAAVYLASGVSKLFDPDWFGGLVTRLRVEQHRDLLADRGLPDWALDLLTDPAFHGVAARVIVLTELAIGVGMLVRRLRPLAIWLAIPFHLLIEVTANVQVFSWAALAALVIWVEPSAPRIRLEVPTGTWVRVVRLFDWTGRFDVSPGTGIRLTSEDGPVRYGSDAVWETLVRLPVTFWPTAPLYAWRRIRRKERA